MRYLTVGLTLLFHGTICLEIMRQLEADQGKIKEFKPLFQIKAIRPLKKKK